MVVDLLYDERPIRGVKRLLGKLSCMDVRAARS
jgi:hypothetical protein